MSDSITVRETCRKRMTLSGVDAQALEGALSQTERELKAVKDEADKLKQKNERLEGKIFGLEAIVKSTKKLGSELADEYAELKEELIKIVGEHPDDFKIETMLKENDELRKMVNIFKRVLVSISTGGIANMPPNKLSLSEIRKMAKQALSKAGSVMGGDDGNKP